MLVASLCCFLPSWGFFTGHPFDTTGRMQRSVSQSLISGTASLPHGCLGYELLEEWQGWSAGNVQHTQMFWCQPALGKSFFQ